MKILGRVVLVVVLNITFASFGLCQSVLEKVKTRENKVSSFLFEFEETYSFPPGHSFDGEEVMEGATEFVNTYSVLSDGDPEKARIEKSGESWSSILKKTIKNKWIHLYDETGKKTFHGQPDNVNFNDMPPLGTISKMNKGRTWASDNSGTNPVYFFRYLSEILEKHDFDIEKPEFDFEGMRCIKIRIRKGPSLTETWYLDVNRDYIPVFWQWKSDSSTTQITIKYAQCESGSFTVWAPSEWTFASSRNGKYSSSRKTKVNKVELSKPLSKEGFELAFPARTKVSDIRDFKNQKTYFVKKDGKTRDIIRADFGKSYEQIYNSQPGERNPKSKRHWYLLLGLLLVVLTVVVVRKKRNE